jgi:hypothetical protein
VAEDDKLKSLEDDADLLGDEPEQDVLFQAQMAAANLFLGYWKGLLYAAGAILAFSALVGGYQSHVLTTQQAGHEALARAERPLEQLRGTDLNEEQIEQLMADVARDVDAAAASAEGPAQAFAYIRAAQFWMQLEDAEAARTAWTNAAGVNASGGLGWSASIGAARAAAEAGDYPQARQLIERATTESGLLGEEAVFTRLQIEALAGDQAAAKASASELESRFPKSGRIAEAKALAERPGSAG